MQIDNLTGDHMAIASGAGAVAGFVLIWSKMRRILASDATDTSAHQSMKIAMENLRSENARLHEEVVRLRDEIDRLRETVITLTSKLADMSTTLARNAFEDQLAREGKLERRKQS